MPYPSSETPRVVALLPAWKAEAFIEPVLRSLAAQTHPNLLILISDDASPDGTAALCKSFVRSDPRFELIRQPINLGWIGNVNALLHAARGRGDYFFFAFHDDHLEPEYVSSLVAELEKNPSAVIAFSDMRLLQADGSESVEAYTELEGINDRATRGKLLVEKKGLWWLPNRGVFRAWAPERIGGMKRHLAGEFVADWPWLTHMTLLGEAIRVPKVLCTKIFRNESISRNWKYSILTWWAVAISCAREIHNSPLRFAERLPLYLKLADFALRIIWRRIRMNLQEMRASRRRK